jgi:hypothetical protein
MERGIASFAQDVRERRYPTKEHGYSIGSEELAAFRTAFTSQ